MGIREKIILLRLLWDISCQKMAKKIGIPYLAYRNYEKGKLTPKPKSLNRIYSFLIDEEKRNDISYSHITQRIKMWQITNNLTIKSIMEDMNSKGLDGRKHIINAYFTGQTTPSDEFMQYIRDNGFKS